MKIINSSGQHRRGILGKWTIKITGISEVYGFGIVDLAHAGSCVSGYAWIWVLNAGKLISKLRHLPLHPFQWLQRRGIHGHECWSAPHHTYHRRNCWRTWDCNPFLSDSKILTLLADSYVHFFACYLISCLNSVKLLYYPGCSSVNKHYSKDDSAVRFP